MRRKNCGCVIKVAIASAMAVVLMLNSASISAFAEESVQVVDSGEIGIDTSGEDESNLTESSSEEIAQEENTTENSIEEQPTQETSTEEQSVQETSTEEQMSEEQPVGKQEVNQEIQSQQADIDKLTQNVNSNLRTNEETGTQEVIYDGEQTLNEYIAGQTEAVREAVAEAKEQLEIAIDAAKLDGTANVDQIGEITAQAAEKASLAAQKALSLSKAAKNNAEAVYKAAEQELLDEIKKYNTYADMYGLETISYGAGEEGYTPRYTEEELAASGLNLKNNSQQAEDKMEEQQSSVEAAREVVQSAEQIYEETVQAEQDTIEAIKQVETVIESTQTESANESTTVVVEEQDDKTAQLQMQETVSLAMDTLNALVNDAVSEQPDLSDLLSAISNKKLAFANATAALKNATGTIDELRQDASRYSAWSKLLAAQNAAKTKNYGQVDTTTDELAESNSRGFDASDLTVVSQEKRYFVEVTPDSEAITAPYSVLAAYVKKMSGIEEDTPNSAYDVYNKSGVGVSANDTMPVVYWVLNGDKIDTSMYYFIDDDGTVTDMNGNEIQLEEGISLFKGYSFKHEADGYYHIDGIKYTYPGVTDSNDPVRPTNPSDTTGSDTSAATTTTTIGDITTPLAETPSAVAASANDTVVVDDNSVALADSITTIEDEDVPLSDSVPKTGDESGRTWPFAAAGSTAIIAALFIKLKKRKRS